jgi:hypothetical protein
MVTPTPAKLIMIFAGENTVSRILTQEEEFCPELKLQRNLKYLTI